MWKNSKHNTQIVVISIEAVDSPVKTFSQFLTQAQGFYVIATQKN